MLTIYLASAGFGLALIAASVVLGGDDFDADTDLDVDVDAGGHDLVVGDNAVGSVSSGMLLPFLSMRFWTYGLGSFGVTGAVLHSIGQPLIIHLPAAGGLGVVLGYAAAWGFRKLQNTAVDSTSHASKLAGLEAEVLLALGPDRTGKIRVQAHGQILDLPAVTQEHRTLPPGERVLIIAARDGIATVEPLSPGQ